MSRSVLCCILLIFAAFNLTAKETTIAFEYYQRLIFIKVDVNETNNLLFLLDTGANTSAIDTNTSDSIGLKAFCTDTVEGSAGKIVVPNVKAKSISVGKCLVKNISLTKYDLSNSLVPPNMHLDGILGTDFLRHYVVSIDFYKKQITLSKKRMETQNYIPFELDNGIPKIKSIINNHVSAYLRYDSGSSLFDTNEIYLNIPSPVLDKLSQSDSTLKPVNYFSATGIGGSIKLPVYKINSVFINTVELKQPYIIVQPQQGYFARPDAVGFFGNNLLEKFQKVTIDFINRKFYVLNY